MFGNAEGHNYQRVTLERKNYILHGWAGSYVWPFFVFCMHVICRILLFVISETKSFCTIELFFVTLHMI